MGIRVRKIYEALFALEDLREMFRINYDRWAELYWKKQLEEELAVKEEKELEKLVKANLNFIKGVYNALIRDKEVQERIERIKSNDWVKVIEGENEQS